MNITDAGDRIIINSFATECFRNVADADYITARTCYRLGLIQQFQWSALQAIEKYLKAILLYNGMSAKNLGHDLQKALRRVESIEAFSIELEDYQRNLIRHIDENGENRYLEQPAYTRGKELLHLDGTVWSIRRYCQVLDWTVEQNGAQVHLLDANLRRIHSEYYQDNPHKFILNGGFLENVLKRKKTDELRQALVWKNFRFGAVKKKQIKEFTFRSTSVNPPHIRHPEDFALLDSVVNFPQRVRNLFRQGQ